MIDNLNNLEKAVATWNKKTFGNIFYNKRKILTQLEGIQAARESKDTSYLKRLEEKLLDDFNSILIQEEIYWRKKSSSDWVNLGDHNTSYFHAKAKTKIHRERVSLLQLSNGD